MSLGFKGSGLEKVCKIAKKLYGFDYVKVITLLECALLQNNIKTQIAS